MSAEILVVLGGVVSLLVASHWWAYRRGSKFARVSFEAEGHQRVEEKLVELLDQNNDLQKKYDDAREKLGFSGDADSGVRDVPGNNGVLRKAPQNKKSR